MANGNGKSVELTETHEEHAKKNVMKYFVDATAEFRKGHRRRAANYLLQAQSVDEFLDRADALMQGDWRDNASLGASALGGLALGVVAGKMLPWKVGPLPAIATLGLAGVVPGFLLKETITVRNILNLGGLLFIAGSWIGSRE